MAAHPEPARGSHAWTLLTSHGRVLLLIAANPQIRVREIAEQAQITERAASGITADLEDAGYLTKQRQGRRTTYVVHPEVAFRHAAESGHRVGELIDVFVP
jgi:DNA-binding MarR family transcriptional regulator